MNSNRPTIFLDLDGVMVTTRQHFSKMNQKYLASYFDAKCTYVFNSIIESLKNPRLIISSDWKLSYDIQTLNNIFKEYGVNAIIEDYTESLWGIEYDNMKDLEVCRAQEILKYAIENHVENWVAIDDLNLSPWIPYNFVHCSRSNEGIKQSGIKDKILNILNK